MVLCLKARESRSLPGLLNACVYLYKTSKTRRTSMCGGFLRSGFKCDLVAIVIITIINCCVSVPLTVSVRCPPPNVRVFVALVSTMGSGHLGALYGGRAEEAALAG